MLILERTEETALILRDKKQRDSASGHEQAFRLNLVELPGGQTSCVIGPADVPMRHRGPDVSEAVHAKLTIELQAKIVAGIRLGAFPSIAARAAGIGASTFYRWMQAGERGAKRFRDFREQVEQAGAEARQAAEWEVRRTNPLAWLRAGPGRTRPGEPGWTEAPESPEWERGGTIIVTDEDEVAYIEKLRAVRGKAIGPTAVEHVVRVVRE